MTDAQSSPQRDYTSSGDSWEKLQSLKEDMEYTIAHGVRRHERGDTLSVQEVLREVETLLAKARLIDAPQILPLSQQELMQSYWEHIAQRKQSATTGFNGLNNALGGGLESKRLVVVLGPPGMGKTALVNQIAEQTANSGRPVLYVTSEDSPFTLLAKTLARLGDVNYTAVLKGWEAERAKINAAMEILTQRQSRDRLRYIDATQGVTLEKMKELAQAHFAQYSANGQGVLVVDYLQRFARAQRSLQGITLELRELVTLLTEQLRAMACELDCCVIALASQKRAAGYGSGDALSSAKESGDIEYTADVLMSITEDKDRKENRSSKTGSSIKPRSLKLDKNRQGDTITISLDWQGDRQRFTEAER